MSVSAAEPNKTERRVGLAAAFVSRTGPDVDYIVLPNLRLYVPTTNSPTPFLPAGPFQLRAAGFLSAELRSYYTFEVSFNGRLHLEINGAVLLETNSSGSVSLTTPSIRLNKGTNAIVAIFASPDRGDASLRVDWAEKGTLAGPIPRAALTHLPAAALDRADLIRRGRELFGERRCIRCHVGPNSLNHMPELDYDAPALNRIGWRQGCEWMAQWIWDPKSERPLARMPKVFHGMQAAQDAGAVAAFLSSLSVETKPAEKVSGAPDKTGEQLFNDLQCAACHVAPGGKDEANKISLRHVKAKFVQGSLAEFLKQPEAHYKWIRMPNFKLSDGEAGQLTSYLEAHAEPLRIQPIVRSAATVARGKELVQGSGCLNCHVLAGGNDGTPSTASRLAQNPPITPLDQLGSEKEACLALTENANSSAPFFGFSAGEIAALKAFLAADRKSLERFVPREFAERTADMLNCRECHGKLEGVPPFDLLGEKLKPEWAARFIGGEVSYRPRPWLAARMPAFPHWAPLLAAGMAEDHGFSPQTPAEPPVDREMAETGRKLVSAVGGFSCVACHAVGELKATQVFEAAGINFVYTSERLLKPYFHRWVMNPLRVDPGTKMPVYFDEQGKSPLSDIYDGDGRKQIEAIWQYLRLGPKMPPPPTQ